MKPLCIFLIVGVFLISACSSNESANMRVRVVDEQGNGIANATVVMGNEDGEMVDFMSTNGLGEAIFVSVPSSATVTAATSCYVTAENRTYYHVDITYAVNASSITKMMGACIQDYQEVDVNIVGTIPGVTDTDITIGAITYGGPSASMGYAYALQDDGNFSVFATGYDNTGAVVGYGVALDQPVDGGSIDIVIDRKDLLKNIHSFENAPPGTMSYYIYASLLRKRAQTNLQFNFEFGMDLPPGEMTTYSTSSFSDESIIGAFLELDNDGNGITDGQIGLSRYLSSSSDQVFDFSSAPVMPRDLTYEPGNAGRPVISWSNPDSRSTMQTLNLRYRSSVPQRVNITHSITVPAYATGVVYPELPDILAEVRPSAYESLSLGTFKFDEPVSYDAYLEALANNDGSFLEAAGLNSYSFAEIVTHP